MMWEEVEASGVCVVIKLKPLIFDSCIATWAQFFDDGTLLLPLKTRDEEFTNFVLVNIIIFLAPMSGFNQVLAEDESVNRLVSTLSSRLVGRSTNSIPDRFPTVMATNLQ